VKEIMFRLRLQKSLLAAGISVTLLASFSGTAAIAAVDPCAVSITKAGVVATSDSVDVSSAPDGIHCIAVFKGVGNDYTFTAPGGITKVDYLVVGGGGGGASGGGGAGGFLSGNDFSVAAATPINITVGAGGSGGTGGIFGGAYATDGSSSAFGTIEALGGGAGGQYNVMTSNTGASGGGSRFDCTDLWDCGTGEAGTSTPGQGNNGGFSTYGSYGAGGGGGGAGGAGFNTVTQFIGANGGIGLQSDITGVSTYYAGGGGGGINNNDYQYLAFGGISVDGNPDISFHGLEPQTTGGGQGGFGGGGNGSSFGYCGGCGEPGAYANATDGAPNTGGGGGGTDPEDINAGAGGSGVVIIRWISAVSLKTVTFSSNLPSGSATITQRLASGEQSRLEINTFSRNGFVFMGWATNPDGSGTTFSDEGMLTTNSDITLYAIWAAGVTHVVTFNSNSGIGSMANQIAGAATTLNYNSFASTDASFDGWNTRADGTGFAYPEGAVFSFDSDTTMYAQWRAIVPSYRVTFYGNGATGGSTSTQSASETTALNLNGFTRTGYSFLGWTATSSNTNFVDGQNYSFTSDLSLYAQWVPQAPNDITFDKNSLTATGTTATQTASSSTQLNSNGFVNDGFTFRNWNTSSDGTGTTYQANYVYSFAAGLTLYAQWGQNVSISFNGNAADSGVAPPSQTTYVGSPGINLPLNTGRFVKFGYRLAGWNTEALGTGTPLALGASSVPFTGNTVLYAQWTPAIYSVLYSANQATAGSEPSPQNFTFGTPIAVADNTGQLQRSGYTFDGWNTAPDGLGITFAAAAVNVSLSNDTVLFAKWVRVAANAGPIIAAPPSEPTPTISPAPTSSPTTAPAPNPSQSPATPLKVVNKNLSGFAAGSSSLSSAMKAALKKLLKVNLPAKSIAITGFTSGTTATAATNKLAKARAAAVQTFLKQLGFKGKVSVKVGTKTSSPLSQMNTVVLAFTK
jgi:uncharacterized repeat protein (TIGR02543 family)